MKENIEIPIILPEQQKIIDWSRKLRSKYISFSTIIEYLISDKKTESCCINDGLNEVRKIYTKYNNDWREQLLVALMIDNYRFEHDIKEGQVVSNGEVVGFVANINYKERKFNLFNSKVNDIDASSAFIGTFNMSDFSEIRSVNFT